MLWDPSYVVGYIDAITARGFTAPIGRWHKHCTPDLRASAEDRVGAAAFRAALGLNALVDVIVATVHDEPISWAAYLCTAAGYDRITAELPDGVQG
ncbi:MAG: hypothetical protein KY464_17125 [Gemmatimonadetes bacterium]|nr:hypothetical protein [Gemmatimonadota bacterium]